MSYDLRLCLPQPGRSAEEIATADIVEPTFLTEATKERNQRLLDLLVRVNPALEVFHFEARLRVVGRRE